MEQAVEPKRSAFPKVLGILGMCFAGLGLLVGLATQGDEVSALVGASFAVSVLHLAAGFTTFRYRRLGPLLFVVYGLAAIAVALLVLTADGPADNPNQHGVDFGSFDDWLVGIAAFFSLLWALTAIVLAAVVRRSCTR